MSNIAQNLTIIEKSVDGAHGIRTCDHRIVGTEKSTELRQPQLLQFFVRWYIGNSAMGSFSVIYCFVS